MQMQRNQFSLSNEVQNQIFKKAKLESKNQKKEIELAQLKALQKTDDKNEKIQKNIDQVTAKIEKNKKKINKIEQDIALLTDRIKEKETRLEQLKKDSN
ncbi:Hypothetical protein FBFL15_2085 [Flavobacterium branchiophilum FL-15]|uniref:Uncharacterized protein n=2 Tax=Flavobacterium branchiophilum TaxID=55197 RepID=G2Z7V9_FLABF|nr:Hypothetical protein FBFL15_2085 [Flavobacterium branchiophilum FL-15]